MQVVVTPENQGLRLDKFLVSQLADSDLSRARINKWIKQGRVWINGKLCQKSNQKVHSGDEVVVTVDDVSGTYEPVPGELDIKYLDSDLIVLNKPPGLNVHPAPSEINTTLVHHLLYHFPELYKQDPDRPGIVHRLDKDTSGLMLVGRTSRAVEELSSEIYNRKLYKKYLALVHGVPCKDSGEIEAPIGRDPVSKTRMKVLPKQGRQALSKYSLICVLGGGEFSLLQVGIVTGRTHQIRVHLSHMGLPILGDSLYGNREFKMLQKRCPRFSSLISRQMLHSWKIGLYHPVTGKWLDFVQQIPRDFLRVLLQLENTCLKVGVTGSNGVARSRILQHLEGGKIAVHSDSFALCREFELGADGWEMFWRTFGEKYFTPAENKLDKRKLFSEIRVSPQFRKEVLDLVKPMAEHIMEKILQYSPNTGIFAVEIPELCSVLLDSRKYLDLLVFVYGENLVAKDIRYCCNDNKSGINSLPQELRPDKRQLANEADLVVFDTGEDYVLQTRARALKDILVELKRKRMKRFCNDLRDIGVI